MTIDIEVDPSKQPDGDDEDALLVIDNLTVAFPTDDGSVKAVRGVSYTVRAGEAMGIVGESGSGKSVSSMAVMGLLPRNARIRVRCAFADVSCSACGEGEYTKLRGDRIAMIFQDPLTSLNPVYTIGYQISEAVLAHNDVSARRKRATARSNCSALSAFRSPNSASTAIRTNCRAACVSASSSPSRWRTTPT